MLSDEIIQANRLKIEAVILTEDEQKESDLEGKRRKLFKERSKNYWSESENKVSKQVRNIDESGR